MPRTAPLAAQFTIDGAWSGGRDMKNVLQYIITPQVGIARADAVGRQAVIVADRWNVNLLPTLPNNYTFEGVTFIDLATATGSTGSVPPPGGSPIVGGSVAEAATPNVSVIIDKDVQAGRGSRRGRLYLPPPAESTVNESGVINAASVTTYSALLSAFLVETNVVTSDDDDFILASQMVTITWPTVDVAQPLIKRPDPDGVGDTNVVLNMICQSVVGTQRRRLRD